MATASDVSARTVAELVVQLGCLTRGEGFVANSYFRPVDGIAIFFQRQSLLTNRFSLC